MKLRKIGGTTENRTHAFTGILGKISAGFIFIMMLLVTADVFGRYVFNKPIKGAGEIIELMMVLVVYLAFAHIIFQKGNVTVDLLTSRLSSRTNAILNTITSLGSVVILGLIVWQLSIKGVEGVVSSHRVTLLLGIPEAPIYFAAAFGGLIACVELLFQGFHSFKQVKDK
ncbi:MAG: TRAP transporter small permease [Dehalococcoidia bacterium]|nr:MAG: TRAP transporter small permease [Dehalococcoidia bacterium]